MGLIAPPNPLKKLTRVCPVQQNRGTGSLCPYDSVDETGLVATVKGDEQPQNEDEQVDVG
jgi:hypothetical protein